jgi:flagellar hook-basal body complex protein FliE
MTIKSISANEIVSRMQVLVARAQAAQANPGGVLSPLGGIASGSRLTSGGVDSTGQSERLDFQSVLKEAVRGVSDAQNVAQSKAQAYQLGDDAVTLEDVMISIQKANLAMQGMVQVRNRLVEAYREVMNLQV